MKASLPDPNGEEPEHEYSDDELAALEAWGWVEPRIAEFVTGIASEVKASMIDAYAKSREAHDHYGDALRKLGVAVEGRARFTRSMEKIRSLRNQSVKNLQEFDREIFNVLHDLK